MKIHKKITIVANLKNAATVRAITREFFSSAGFDRKWTGRLVLISEELFINAVEYGCRPNDKINIEFSQSQDDEICFTITDAGANGITPAELRNKIEYHGSTHSPKKTSGRGLAVITHAWADDYHIKQARNGGLAISFTKKLPSPLVSSKN